MRYAKSIQFAVLAVLCSLGFSSAFAGQGRLVGKPIQWHPVELHFEGPEADELASSPNPFFDYRLQAHFISPSGTTYAVPGFFNGNGRGEGQGNIWTVRFTPDAEGTWTYRASFRRGENVAVDLDPVSGTPCGFDGTHGTFDVSDAPADAPDFYKWGRLDYVGGHYLKFRDGPYWIKGGCDSPEDFLSFTDFDGTPDPGQHYSAHREDWHEGDPTWRDGKGKAIIGLLNYFASQHVNSIYFLTMNIGGDGKNVWPFAGNIDPEGSPENDNLHYDISKLHQWEIVFQHAQSKGIFLHFVFNEAERKNKLELDEAELGVERKLYYREIIARFGHHNALQWNICEEYDLALDLGPERVKEFARYIDAVDPYDHPITVHHKGRNADPSWLPFLGFPHFSTTSFQFYDNTAQWGTHVEKWRRLTEVAGRPLPINMDEFKMLNTDNEETVRKEVLWPTYLSGGHVEYILDRGFRKNNFKRTENTWRWTWYARRFMEENLPFWEMEPNDPILQHETTDMGGGQVFVKNGSIYAIYLPVGQPSGRLMVSSRSGPWEKRWFNPRTGIFEGKSEILKELSHPELGDPPSAPQEDWVILFKRADRQ